MRRPAAGSPWIAALGLLLLYVAAAAGHTYSIDGLLMFEQARSLALHASFHFAEPVMWGGVYTTAKYGVGQSIIYVPGVWLYGHLGVHPAFVPALHVDDLYRWVGPWLQALTVAVTAAFVLLLVGEAGGSSRAAWWGFVLFALGSPALIYARGDWAQPLSGLCWIAALYAAARLRRSTSWGMLAALAVAVCFGILTRAVDGTFAALAAAIVVAWRPRPLAVLAVAFAAGLGLTGLVDLARFGSPFDTGYPAAWSTPLATGLAGVLFSPARGLLWEFPALLLAPAGFLALRRRGRSGLGIALALSCGLELLSTAAWQFWWGGYDWGLRLFLPALPALAVLSALGVDSLRGAWASVAPAAALAVGALSSVPPLFVDMNTGYGHFADGTAASWQLGAFPLLGAWRSRHAGGVDLFWWQASHGHRALLVVPLALGVAAVALFWRALPRGGSASLRMQA